MKDPLQSRASGVLVSVAAYMLALLAAIWVGNVTDPGNPLVTIALADLAATLTIFAFSVAFNNSSIYDPYWSVKPVVIAFYYLAYYFSGELTFRQGLVVILILAYSIRLTSNFYRDWKGLDHEDWRYAAFRKRFPGIYWLVSFVGIHFFPTVMVYLGCLPMLGAMDPAGHARTDLLDLAGVVVMAGAIVLAFIADEQLRVYRKDPMHQGTYIRTGLWKYSRHPNYLGEILTWWGLYLLALSAGWQWWWTGAGAVAITLMFVFISIPMMDKKNLQTKAGYDEYRRSTPALLPFRLGRR